MNALAPRPCAAAPPGPFLQMHSGYCVSLTEPDCAGLPLSDIALSLARTARFRGATKGIYAYSVAQHSVFVARLLREGGHGEAMQRAGLLHDAHEALIGDIPTPIKRWLGHHWLAARERPLIAALYQRFGVPPALAESPEVKGADALAFATERRDLMAASAWPWPSPCEPSPRHRITPEPEAQSFIAFMRLADRLGLA